MHSCVWIFVWMFSSLLVYAGSYGESIFNFVRNYQPFFKILDKFTFSPAKYEFFNFSSTLASRQPFLFVILLCLKWYIVILICISWWLIILNTLHVLTAPLYLLFVKYLLKSFGHFGDCYFAGGFLMYFGHKFYNIWDWIFPPSLSFVYSFP